MKITDMYRKFLEENKNELRSLLIGCAKAIRDSTEELPEDEVVAAWKSFPKCAGHFDCNLGDQIMFIAVTGTCDTEDYLDTWMYQFDDGNSRFDALQKYLTNHYGKDFWISGDVDILVSEEGTRITYAIGVDASAVDSPEANLAENLQKLANDLKECLATYEVKIDVCKGHSTIINLTWFFK